MGLFIIKSFMDEVSYEAGPPNKMKMTKSRSVSQSVKPKMAKWVR